MILLADQIITYFFITKIEIGQKNPKTTFSKGAAQLGIRLPTQSLLLSGKVCHGDFLAQVSGYCTLSGTCHGKCAQTIFEKSFRQRKSTYIVDHNIMDSFSRLNCQKNFINL